MSILLIPFGELVLFLTFYVVLTPVAIVNRILGRDLLGLKFKDGSQTSFLQPVTGDQEPWGARR
jgi:hypothetical protein